MVNCSSILSGRFITIMVETNEYGMWFAEIFAFEEFDLASTATEISAR